MDVSTDQRTASLLRHLAPLQPGVKPAGRQTGLTLYPERLAQHISAMALLKIARMGHPVLRAASAVVEDPTAPWVRRLVEDMVETMEDAGGAGIAAPQGHQAHRIVVFQVLGDRLSDMPGDVAQDLTVLINPVVETIGRERALGWEGCLSVPGLRGVVPRHLHVRYRGTGLDGEIIERE